MPACILMVHNDPEFAEPAGTVLRAAGHDVVSLCDSMAALYALERPQYARLLITRVRFPSGMPNGVALACMARLKQPGIKVLFTSFPEVRRFTDGVGEFLPRPMSDDALLETVGRMLAIHPDRLLRNFTSSLPAFLYGEPTSASGGNVDRYRHEEWPYFFGGRR